MTGDLTGLRPAVATATAEVLRDGVKALTDTREAVEAQQDRLLAWTGVASVNFAGRLNAASDDLDVVTWTANAGARLISDFAQVLARYETTLATIDADEAAALARTTDPALGLAQVQGAYSSVERDDTSRARELDKFDAEACAFAERLAALIARIDGRPRTLRENTEDFATAVGRTFSSTAFVGFGWVIDPSGWWGTVKGTPGGGVDYVAHPTRAVSDTFALDDFRAGRIGEGLGEVLAGMLIGRGLGRGLGRVGGRAASVATATAQAGGGSSRVLPRNTDGSVAHETVEELLAGVDLERDEDQPATGQEAGHTLSRHVNVDDEYLVNRIVKGVPNKKGKLVKAKEASRWAGLDIAEEGMTEVLRENESYVMAQAEAKAEEIKVNEDVPAEWGTLYQRGDPPREALVDSCRIILRRDSFGNYYVLTAFLGNGLADQR